MSKFDREYMEDRRIGEQNEASWQAQWEEQQEEELRRLAEEEAEEEEEEE